MISTTAAEAEAIAAIRLLAVDMVERAQSGHPGIALGAAPMAFVLFTKIMSYNPADPAWLNRDRFVLSAGHGTALLYALLHLAGFDLTMDDLKAFRQHGSRTPGHPEYGHTPGVETTTGPLGQGISTAVGMALAERRLAAMFNTEELPLFDYHTFVICSDGDLMEGVSSEASSLAGHLKLGRLICLYDSNGISIEGPTTLTFTENVQQRYQAYGWHVDCIDGNNTKAIEQAILQAKTIDSRPSLLIIRTTIGFGSPHKANTSAAHGEPLGTEEVRLVKRQFGFPEELSFVVPDPVRELFRRVAAHGATRQAAWHDLWRRYSTELPDKARQINRMLNGNLPEGWEQAIPRFPAGEALATRQASKTILTALAPTIPLLAGGSADLAQSTGTIIAGSDDFSAPGYSGATLHFGVREHAMAAIMNGMALSKLLIPYGATFLVFADYMKPAIRIAALMQVHTIFIFSHDSIALGQDGPTHQPIEQLAMLRATPGLTVIRPADANETAAAWKIALMRNSPIALILSRQSLPVLDPDSAPVAEGAARGAYILSEWHQVPEPLETGLIFIATGSEVHIALETQGLLKREQIPARVVSMPSRELFEEQAKDYRESVLPPQVRRRVVIEAASPFGWEGYAGTEGTIIGIDRFGTSSPGPAALEAFGFTPTQIKEGGR